MTKTTLEMLKNERDSLHQKLEAINKAIEEYQDEKTKPFIWINDRSGNYKMVFKSLASANRPLDGFPVEETWLNQTIYLLKNRNRFMSNFELADALSDYHYGFNVDKLKRKVSVAISAAYKSDRVDGLVKVGVTRSAKDALWGFADWLTDDGKIKEDNRPFGVMLNQKITIG